MVGIILVTHGSFGDSLLGVAAEILGKSDNCLAISVDISKGMDQLIGEISAAADRLDKGKGVLILTDMFGGTPSNLSLSLLASKNLEVITGINLPMLLKVLSSRNMSLKQLIAEAKNAGQQGILVAGELLRRKVES